MAKSENLSDNKKYQIVTKELESFNKIVKEYDKLLQAIGEL